MDVIFPAARLLYARSRHYRLLVLCFAIHLFRNLFPVLLGRVPS